MADPTNPVTLSDDEIAEVEELAATLTAEQVADYLGMSRTTFFKIIRDNPEVKKAWRKGRVKKIADVGNTLYRRAVGDGDVGACCFILKTQGGWREVKEEEKADSTPTVNINFTDAVKPKSDDA